MTGEDDLDLFFAAARKTPPVNEGLMSRVLADAEAAQPRGAQEVFVPAVNSVPETGWRRLLSAMSGSLGGAPGVAGLACVAIAGIYIGYAGPVTSDWLAGALSAGEEINLIWASDLFLSEG